MRTDVARAPIMRRPTGQAARRSLRGVALLCTALSIGVIGVIGVSGCGWQLRSAPQLDALDGIAIQGHYAGLRSHLEQALARNMIDTGPGATHTLVLLDEQEDRRIASVDQFGRAAEIELRYSTRFHIADASGQPVTPTERIELMRIVRTSPDNASAATEEEADTRDELISEITRQLLRRIERFATQQAAPEAAVTAPADIISEKTVSPGATHSAPAPHDATPDTTPETIPEQEPAP